eukprot:269045_1
MFSLCLVVWFHTTIAIPTWNTTVPDLNVNHSAGLPLIPQQNFTIYNSTLSNGKRNSNGTYNHGPMPIFWNNMYYVSWYNSPQNESQYMRVLYSTSTNGENWSKPIQAFTNFTTVGQENEPFFISPTSNNLYITCSLYKYDDIKTLIVREIKTSGSMGDIFWLSTSVPNNPSVTKYINKTFLDMDNVTISDMETYISSLLYDNVPDGGSSNSQTFNERSMYLIPNTTSHQNGVYSQEIMLLLRASGGNDHYLWASSCIDTFKNMDIIVPSDKLIGCRPGIGVINVNLVNVLNGRATNISENNQTCTWSEPVVTNIVDAPSRTCVASLEDGRIYYVGNPVAGSRHVLVLAISNNGLQFTNGYAVRYDPPPIIYPGKAKVMGFQYPSAMWINDYLYITYSVGKENIQISKVKISDIMS